LSAQPITPRFIDPRGQRFGAGLSAVTLVLAIAAALWAVALLVGLALAASAAFGTRWFPFSRPWLLIRARLALRGTAVEPELPPRFAQALGATFIGAGLVLLALGVPLGWLLIGAVAALQTVLAVTGYCLGCRLYGLHWLLPELFDRFVLAVRVPGRG
jgi:hypothetical protein